MLGGGFTGGEGIDDGMTDGDDVLVGVEAHLLTVLGQDSGRAGVTFLGADRVDVLRFGPDPQHLVRYVTLGMSRAPMTDPTAPTLSVSGPRAELVLSVLGLHDSVLRRLAVLASVPTVEGVVVAPGATLELGEPLWDGGAATSVLVGEPGGLVPDLDLEPSHGRPRGPVRFLPLLPMTAAEAAHKRVHGPQALQELWLRHGTDLRDPARRAVPLEPPAATP